MIGKRKGRSFNQSSKEEKEITKIIFKTYGKVTELVRVLQYRKDMQFLSRVLQSDCQIMDGSWEKNEIARVWPWIKYKIDDQLWLKEIIKKIGTDEERKYLLLCQIVLMKNLIEKSRAPNYNLCKKLVNKWLKTCLSEQ